MKPKLQLLSRTAATLATYTALFAAGAPCQSEERPLQLGVTGSTPGERTKDPTRILAPTDMQQLILKIAEELRTRAYVAARIADEFFTLEDVANVGLLREEQGLNWIDFNLLLVEDHRAPGSNSQPPGGGRTNTVSGTAIGGRSVHPGGMFKQPGYTEGQASGYAGLS